MCGRTSFGKKPADLEKRFNATFKTNDVERHNPLPNFNICPTTFVPVKADNDTAHFQFFHWGMDIITWTGEAKKNVINARIENILKIPAFKESLNSRRCILPVTSYFEWKTIDQVKLPYLIKLKSQEIFSLAGLWQTQASGKGNEINKFVLITQPPTPKLSFIHDRMPGILSPEKEDTWLDPSISGAEALKLINQYPDEDLQFYTVSSKINKSFENDSQLIVEHKHQIVVQGSLF